MSSENSKLSDHKQLTFKYPQDNQNLYLKMESPPDTNKELDKQYLNYNGSNIENTNDQEKTPTNNRNSVTSSESNMRFEELLDFTPMLNNNTEKDPFNDILENEKIQSSPTINDEEIHKTENEDKNEDENEEEQEQEHEGESKSRELNNSIMNHHSRNNVSIIQTKPHDIEYTTKEDNKNIDIQRQLTKKNIFYIDNKNYDQDEKYDSYNRDKKKQEIIDRLLRKKLNEFNITQINKLEYISSYHDGYLLLSMRKKIWKSYEMGSQSAYKIITNNYFEYLTLSVIIFDTVILSLNDSQKNITNLADYFSLMCLGYYTFEAIIKIYGLGFIFNRKAYLRDTWNIMDIIIVIVAYIPIIYGNNSFSLRGLRLLRLLRPLRTISLLKSLRIIVKTVFETLPYIRDIIFMAFISIFIFSILGLQLFMGITKNRCIDINTGIPIYNGDNSEINYQEYCGKATCDTDTNINLACAKMIADPNYGITNFGTILWSMLNVFVITTQEGWSSTMAMLEIALHPAVILYFVLCLIINAYYFINLIMAVLTAIFTINCREDNKFSDGRHEDSYEEILMQLINDNKLKIMELINQHKKGQCKYDKIQFIRGNLYLYNPNNPKIKRTFSKAIKSCWNNLKLIFIGGREESYKTTKKNRFKKWNSTKSLIQPPNSSLPKLEQNGSNEIKHLKSMAAPKLNSPKSLNNHNKLKPQKNDANQFVANPIINQGIEQKSSQASAPTKSSNSNYTFRTNESYAVLIPKKPEEYQSSQVMGKTPIKNERIKISLFSRNMKLNLIKKMKHEQTFLRRKNNIAINKYIAYGKNNSRRKGIHSKDDNLKLNDNDHVKPKISYTVGIRRKSKVKSRTLKLDSPNYLKNLFGFEPPGNRGKSLQFLNESQKLESFEHDKKSESEIPELTRFTSDYTKELNQFSHPSDEIFSKRTTYDNLQEYETKEIKDEHKNMINKLEIIEDNPDDDLFSNIDLMNEIIEIEDEELEEYLENDLHRLRIGIERFIIDLKYLKVEHDKLKGKQAHFDEQITIWKDDEHDQNKIRDRDIDKYSKDKLDQIYYMRKDKNHENLKRNKLVFKIPMKHDPNFVLDSGDIRKSKKVGFRFKHRKVARRLNLTYRYSMAIEGEEDKLLNYETIRSVARKAHNKMIESDIEMLYVLVNNQLNDDLKINAQNILDFQAIEYFNFDDEYTTIREIDRMHKSIKFRNWSGHEIIPKSYCISNMNTVKKELMQKYESIWEYGYFGLLQAIRRKIRNFCDGNLFTNFIFITVLANIVFLAGIGVIFNDDDNKDSAQNVAYPIFMFIFAIEMALKLIGMGPIGYFKDVLNIIDGATVLLSIIEFAVESGSHAFSAFRIFRIFRILRMTKLLKTLAFMRILINVLGNALKDFFWLMLLIILFVYIYTLLGMQLLSGAFDYPDNVGWDKIRNNFDTFPQAIISVFQLMTVENWNTILVFAVRSDDGYISSILYLVSWVIISNYILLNLLMAILLSQFEGDTIGEDENELENNYKGNEERDKFETDDIIEPLKLHFTLTDPSLVGKAQSSIINQATRRKSVSNVTIFYEDDGKPEALILYEDNYCEKSLYIFKMGWKSRQILYKLIKAQWFDKFILVLIVISALKLAIDTYINDNDPSMGNINTASDYLQMILTILFTVEAIIKIIALGFVLHKGCYLRDNWNILDFIIIVMSLFDIAMSETNTSFIRILRLLRILRPLRLVTQNKSLRLMITALMESISGIFNVILVILLMSLAFAILGVGLLRNKLGVCDVSSNPNLNRYGINYDTCQWLGYTWITWNVNWDNVFYGMLSLFILSTQEGWPDYMFQSADANYSDVGPVENNNMMIFIYFAIFLLIITYFLVNLFVGVILYEYTKAENKEKKKYIYLTPEQEKWIQIQKLILDVKLDLRFKPNNTYQQFWLNIIQLKIFELIIIICIIANMIVLSLYYDESPDDYTQNLETINNVFTAIFFFEMFAKMSAYGIKNYFVDSWNKFDFFVVLTSVIEIIIESTRAFSATLLRFGPQIIRVLRILRLNRLFKLSKQFPSVQKLFKILIFSLPSLANACGLVLLTLYIYAILATYLFSQIAEGDSINQNLNFYNFSNSLLTLFIAATGENWYLIMFDTNNPSQCVNNMSDCSPGQAASYIFWITYIIIMRYVMLNLLIMVLLDMFLDYLVNDDNVTQSFSENVESFKEIWQEFSKKNNQRYIHNRYLISFFLNLEEPLGFQQINETPPDKEKIKNIAKSIMKLNVPIDLNGYVSFHHALFAAFKKASCPIDIRKNRVQYLLDSIEANTRNKIEAIEKTKKNGPCINECTKSRARFNPLAQLLYVSMTIRAWRNYTNKVIDHYDKNNLDIKYTSSNESERY